MRIAAAILCLGGLAAQAQPAPPTESVTVTGARSRQVLDRFVQGFAAPTRMTGKLARWEDGVCPVTVGLKPAFTKFISARVQAVAAQVGAPVNSQDDCKPNIEIVFTTAPQALIDNVRKQDEAFLGYADNAAQGEALAKVTRPIQAWYLTATKDLRGNVLVDSRKAPPVEITVPDPYHNPPFLTVYTRQGAMTVTGSRLGDGLRSGFYHVIIVADPTKLADFETGALADYIALLALTQLSSLDACQPLPSIVNMLAPVCDSRPSALTDSDLGYLRGLYKMGADRTARSQQDAIAYQMQQAQDGK